MNRSGIQACPQGFFCPANTGHNWTPCPLGTYGSQVGLKNEEQCQPCDAGKYCNQLNSTSPNGDCAAGYYCISRVDTPTPQLPNGCPVSNIGGKCTPGSFCQLGSHTTTGAYCNYAYS